MRRLKIYGAGFSVLTLILIRGMAAESYEAIRVENGGRITGVVRFAGNPPAPEQVKVTRDREVCGKGPLFSESLVVAPNRGVRDAVLSLIDIQRGRPLQAESATLQMDQRGCAFHPHVLIVPAGATFDLLNSDGILHNFRTVSTANPTLNKAQPKFKKRLSIKLDKPETIKVNCDVHEWMNAWIVVAEHPYYTGSDAQGSFAITDVPAGTYKIQLWHERLGKQTRQVMVPAGGEAKVAFEVRLP